MKQMLINNFFKIKEYTHENESTLFIIELIKNHPIYDGHFPGNPIVPGVCSIEIIKECAAFILNCSLHFHSIEQCKFLSPIDPIKTGTLSISLKLISLNETEFSISATIMSQLTPCVFIKSKLKKQL